jgi:polyisoprenoid-binding protein YceI
MKKYSISFFFFCAALIFSQSVISQNQEWLVRGSSIKFKIKNAGFTVDGTFGSLSAKINFDESKSYGNAIEASVDVETINTDNKSRDGHLKKAEYFDAGKYPKIILRSTVIVKEKDGNYKGYFKLSLKNNTKDIVIPFTFMIKDGKTLLKGSFTINRLDFGVGTSSMILSNTANLFIELNLIKK